MNNALLYFGGLLVMALAVLFAVPYFVDWNTYRGVFEEEASRMLGREVRVGGAINLRLLPSPYVRIEKVRIAEAGSSGSGSLFRAESFTMYLSVPPLLRGVLEAHEVELRRPSLHLAVDKNGAGNWGDFAVNPGLLPFMPRDVALQSVKLIDGVVSVQGPDESELARLDAVNGELVAEALEGPYKFRGTASWIGGARSVRFATARPDAAGSIRVKVAVGAPESGNSYLFDGRIGDLKTRPKIDGELSAKLSLGLRSARGGRSDAAAVAEPPLEAPPEPPADSAASAPPRKSADGPGSVALPQPAALPKTADDKALFDFKTKLSGDATAVTLAGLTATLEQGGGPPQLITGSASVGWSEGLSLGVTLQSQWLDLDRLAGNDPDVAPFEAARGLFEGLISTLPLTADTNAAFVVDQVNLGGEAVSNVHLSASRSGGPLELKGLKANLPGGTRLALDGVLKSGETAPRFDGAVTLTGQSLLRFVAWGLKDKDMLEGRTDGPFGLEGRLALGDGTIEITEASADIAAMPLSGEVRLGLGERRKLVIALEGERVDVSQIRSGLLGFGSIQALFSGAEPQAGADGGQATGPQEKRLIDLASTDLALSLRVAELVDGSRVLKDVAARLSLEKGRLSIPALKFATPEGLVVDAQGEANDVPNKPTGALHGLIAAPTVEAAAAFARLLDLGEQESKIADRLKALTPIRVAGTLAFGARGGGGMDLSLDGTMHGGRARAALHLDGGSSDWRTKPIDLTVDIESPSAADLLGAVFGSKNVELAQASSEPRGGRLEVKAAGIPASGLLSLASVSSEDLSLDFDGRVALPEAGADVAGKIRVAARDARAVLGFAGLPLAEGAAGAPMHGTASLTMKAGTTELAATDLAVGASRLSGRLALKDGGAAKRTLTGDLVLDQATIAGLLAPLLARPSAAAGEIVPPELVAGGKAGQPDPGKAAQQGRAPAPQALANAPPVEEAAVGPIWPEAPFDLASLETIDGRITARIGTLALEPGLSIGEARLVASLAPGGIKVEALEGKALGGTVTSSFDIERAAAGIGFAGKLRIDIASKADAPPPGDVAAFALDFAGRALSPGALIDDLKGKGEISVGDATLQGKTPSAITAVVEAALAGTGPAGGAPLVEAIKTALKEGELKLGKIAIPVELRDGAVRLEKVQLEAREGRSTLATAVELSTMRIDSEWQIEPRVVRPSQPGKPVLLPPVTVVYAGKLRDIASLEPVVSVGALERELTVRKMERDVEELERLRKLDQTRAKEEAARLKALEAERAKGLAAPPAGTGSPPGTAPANPGPPPSGTSAPAPGADDSGGFPVDPAAAGSADPSATGDGVDGGAGGATSDAAAALPAEQASAPPSPTPRRRKPVDEAWRPFQTTPY